MVIVKDGNEQVLQWGAEAGCIGLGILAIGVLWNMVELPPAQEGLVRSIVLSLRA